MPRVPQWKPRLIYPNISTSRSLAKVSALAECVFWRILSQADDQGRFPGDLESIKDVACPARKDITEENLPALLEELDVELIVRYSTGQPLHIPVVQIRTWWKWEFRQQWAYPSEYPPPPGWPDHLRYRSGGKVIEENWPPPKRRQGEQCSL